MPKGFPWSWVQAPDALCPLLWVLTVEAGHKALMQQCATQPTLHLTPCRGFSYVDLVEGLRDGRFYALKRILCHDKEDRQAALHEVEMHGLFDHPNILRLVAHCMVEKGAKHEAWLLLPYVKVREVSGPPSPPCQQKRQWQPPACICQGGTLWSEVQALREKGTFMPEQRIVLILHGICRGLQAIHSKGYAHR